ncbi:trans-1,2-dihydrobenzene-1,2-diol dehydrogenase-like [Periplaneta americana]|uniref:trans-1,2-dihydrobenzene-1,2-diol dehydrogenase-like n=1 Tax=Periplaneta americana TaxID=6978 RepID=UPI0037E75B8F
MATRWGIASAGMISHDFVAALRTLPSNEHKVVAVAARQLDRAKEFADDHNIPAAYGSYQDLANDPNIDVVYIGAIHPQHLSISKLMLEAGKHVLCEKPLTMNLKETKELVTLAKQKKLFLMEAVWSRCFPAYDVLRKELEAGTLGDVRQVIVNLGAPIQDMDRIKQKDLGGGAIMDMGVYCLQFAVMVFGARLPDHIVALGHLNSQGVDSDAAAILNYNDGKTATLSINTNVSLPNEAIVLGTKGSAKVPYPFWSPSEVVILDKTIQLPLPKTSHKFNYLNSIGLVYEANEVRDCLKKGLLESPKMTHKESMVISELEDILRKQVGVKYLQDI